MSKIGKISISIPEKVKVALNGSVVNIEGHLEKILNLDLEVFDFNLDNGKSFSIKPQDFKSRHKKIMGYE